MRSTRRYRSLYALLPPEESGGALGPAGSVEVAGWALAARVLARRVGKMGVQAAGTVTVCQAIAQLELDSFEAVERRVSAAADRC